MNIAYVANIRLPTEKAHGYQIMRVCSALAARGNNVTLYVPRRGNHITEEPFGYYGIERNFTVECIEAPDLMPLSSIFGPAAFFLSSLVFLRALSSRLPAQSVVYTRNAEAVWYFSRRGRLCFYSAHNWRGSLLSKYFLRRATGVVCNTRGTADAVSEGTGLPVTVIQNAADPNPFAGADKASLRSELGLPAGDFLVLYSGHLYDWKGSATLFAAAKMLRDKRSIRFICIGGVAEDVKRARQEAGENVAVLGHQKKAFVPKFLAAADLLVLPNENASEESARFTSPLKLFEYMASGTPILASDLPSLREVLSEKMCLFAEAGKPVSFAARITEAASNPDALKPLSEAALGASAAYTWGAHAESLAAFLKRR